VPVLQSVPNAIVTCRVTASTATDGRAVAARVMLTAATTALADGDRPWLPSHDGSNELPAGEEARCHSQHSAHAGGYGQSTVDTGKFSTWHRRCSKTDGHIYIYNESVSDMVR
jgi:hypothetical protein